MEEFKYTVTDPEGIHARPAGGLVQLAKGFDSKITISAGAKNADAKRLFQLLEMGVKTGSEVTVTAEGSDEAASIAQLKEYLEANL